MRARNSRCFRERVRHREFISVVIEDMPITLIWDSNETFGFFLLLFALRQRSRAMAIIGYPA